MTVRTCTMLILIPIMLGLTACSDNDLGFMSPAGPIAVTEHSMFWEITAITLVVVVPIFVLTPYLLWRYSRKRNAQNYAPEWEFSERLEWFIWGVPVLIVLALTSIVWLRTHQLDPYRSLSGPGQPLDIQVVALDWKWLFIYPGSGIASVNEMVIPVGRPINLKLTSASVMQSFHIPKLAGQIYVMAGMTTALSLRADRIGEFHGRNTQYNGKGFASQHFVVKALTDTGFTRWQTKIATGHTSLDRSTFLQLAEPSVQHTPTFYYPVIPDMFTKILQLSTRSVTPAATDQPAGQDNVP